MNTALIVILSLILAVVVVLAVWYVMGMITLINFLEKQGVDFHYREEEEEEG